MEADVRAARKATSNQDGIDSKAGDVTRKETIKDSPSDKPEVKDGIQEEAILTHDMLATTTQDESEITRDEAMEDPIVQPSIDQRALLETFCSKSPQRLIEAR